MIEYILPDIRDAGDYITALSMFKADAPLSGEDAEKMVALYQKYGRDADDPAMAKLYAALDLMPGRGKEDAGDFAGLALPDADLDALFTIKGLASGETEPDQDLASAIVETVTGGTLTRPVDILLARAALNIMSGSWDFGGLREQVVALAWFLSSIGTDELDKYAVLMEEVQRKCR